MVGIWLPSFCRVVDESADDVVVVAIVEVVVNCVVGNSVVEPFPPKVVEEIRVVVVDVVVLDGTVDVCMSVVDVVVAVVVVVVRLVVVARVVVVNGLKVVVVCSVVVVVVAGFVVVVWRVVLVCKSSSSITLGTGSFSAYFLIKT